MFCIVLMIYYCFYHSQFISRNINRELGCEHGTVNSSKCTIFTAIKFYSKIITDLEEICWDTRFHNQLKNIIKITILKT